MLSFEYIENRQRKRWRFFVSGRCSEEYLDIVIPIETYIPVSYTHLTLPTMRCRRVDLGGCARLQKKKKKAKQEKYNNEYINEERNQTKIEKAK
ncbi:hypothetical protein [Escherichia coli]|uniref:hypothetical protein n=1 Tax=Escherichia coli TaxID=562 RepID=UPI000BB96FC1|nr:hypothetical protein [Escherichia coli]